MRRSLDALFQQFCEQRKCVEGKSLKTIQNYTENFELLRKFKPDIKLKDLTKETMVDFFLYLDTRPRKVGTKMVVRTLKNSSKATIRGKLSSFFDWLIANGYMNEKKHPFEKIAHPIVDYSDRRAFEKEEFDRIYLTVCRDIQWENELQKKRNMAWIMFLVLTGVRKGEMLGLRLDDINLKTKMLTVRAEISKSKFTRYIPLDDSLLVYLKEYLAARKNYTTPYLWVSSCQGDRNLTEHGAKHFIDRLSKVTGLNCHLHRFRHTFAVNFYIATKDLLRLRNLLGHRDVKTTISRYLRWLPDNDLRAELEALRVALFKKII